MNTDIKKSGHGLDHVERRRPLGASSSTDGSRVQHEIKESTIAPGLRIMLVIEESLPCVLVRFILEILVQPVDPLSADAYSFRVGGKAKRLTACRLDHRLLRQVDLG